MQTEKLQIAEIRYNPEREGFEALVSVFDAGHSYHYPAFIAAPMHAEFELVSRGLSQKALEAHRSARPGMRMQLRPLVRPAIEHGLPLAA
ncbi:hypothetical protein N4R57_00680 [Rhodobacteraceae bacterium D3-12]|nr:hypothetical protein N4R57_00680 [Rhodobacteraceae bacterium D3-12]